MYRTYEEAEDANPDLNVWVGVIVAIVERQERLVMGYKVVSTGALSPRAHEYWLPSEANYLPAGSVVPRQELLSAR